MSDAAHLSLWVDEEKLSHRLSVVVPMYNEEELASDLIQAVQVALINYPFEWELIVVDDGSSDATWSHLNLAAKDVGPHVRLIRLLRNFKQTAAMQAGIDAARGDVIVTMDGDLQNDPRDIPKLVHHLLSKDLDMVAAAQPAMTPTLGSMPPLAAPASERNRGRR